MRGRWARLRDLFFRRRAERDTDEEFRFHIDMETRKNVDAGMDPKEARRLALARFGGVERHRERLREGREAPMLEPMLRDLRQALRSLRRAPSFTLVSVVTIALGVGATAAVFSIGNAMLLRPLDLPDAERVVSVDENRRGAMSAGLEGWRLPYPRYMAYADGTRDVFTALAGRVFTRFAVRVPDRTVSVAGARTSGNYFAALGLVPQVGSFYTRDDEPGVVLSDRLWRQHFGGDPGVVGRTVNVDSRPMTVLGVTPRGFGGAAMIRNDLWVPMRADGSEIEAGDWDGWVAMLGRLRPGVSIDAAEAAATRVALAVPPDEPQTTVRGAWVSTLSGVPRNARTAIGGFLLMLLVTATAVLLIAGANIGGMLSARTVARRRELAVRLSLGAGRAGVVRHLTAEGALLFLVGGVAGIGIARVCTALVERVPLPPEMGVDLDVAPDMTVFLFAFAATALVGLAFTLLPAVQASQPDLVPALRQGGRGGSATGSRMRRTFVGGQVVMATLLLVVALLFVRSVQAAADVELGFDPEGVVAASTNLTPHGYDAERGLAFWARLVEETSVLPGVVAAGVSQHVPLDGSRSSSDVRNGVDGEGHRRTNASLGVVDVAWFEAMGVEPIAGRVFTSEDAWGTPPVAVVNRTLAERLWPEESPLGRPIEGLGGAVVVGVVGDGKYTFISENPTAFAWRPLTQQYRGDMSLMVRAPGSEAAVLRAVEDLIRELDPNLAVESSRRLEDVVGYSLYPQRIAAWLIGTFGVLGLLLAALGVYGVQSFQVAQRTRELGIRRALGARPSDLVAQVVRGGALLAIAGCALGLIGGAAAARAVGSLLVGVAAFDVVTFATVPIVLTGVAIVACLVPARRAVSVEATEALRTE